MPLLITWICYSICFLIFKNDIQQWKIENLSEFKNNNNFLLYSKLSCWWIHAWCINKKEQSDAYFSMHAIGIFLISWDVFMKFMLRWKIPFPLVLPTFQYIFFRSYNDMPVWFPLSVTFFKLLTRMNIGRFRKKLQS